MTDSSLARPPRHLLRSAALFLDFDGTLVEIAARPDAVSVSERLAALLRQLSETLEGRIAIISGRPVAGVRALLDTLSIAIAGSHGQEILWPDGRLILPERPADLDRILKVMTEFAQNRPGLLVEEKPLGAALHYRGAPEERDASHQLAQVLARESGLHIQTGKMLVELRSGAGDKGTALRALMAAEPMAGHRPVFIGDDDTDEPAMAAAQTLGGAGILVGAPRPTAARYRLANVAETLDWLETANGEGA